MAARARRRLRRAAGAHPRAGQKQFIQTLWDDLEIWRYQVYVEHPILAKQDAKPYGALRKWARQFYDLQA